MSILDSLRLGPVCHLPLLALSDAPEAAAR